MKAFVFCLILIFSISRNQADRESGHITSTNITSKLENKNVSTLTHENIPVSGKYTEGGMVEAKNSNLKDSYTKNNSSADKDGRLISPADEFGKKVSSVKPRKGVKYPSIEKLQPESTNSNPTSKGVNETLTTVLPIQIHLANNNTSVNFSTPSHTQYDNNITDNEKPKIPVVLGSITTTQHPHKPTFTFSVDEEDNSHKITPIRPLESSSSSTRPKLVLPIIITVFALPLFAVLGYFALKHGREAWKNRHYRRMDFLLDGMYND